MFSLDAAKIGQNFGFYIDAPLTSTILVNITGATANLINFGFYFMDYKDAIPGIDYISGVSEFFPNSNILFNFLDATLLTINQIEINGSILAPFAHVDFMKNSHIDGNLIAYSLSVRANRTWNCSMGNFQFPNPQPCCFRNGFGWACYVQQEKGQKVSRNFNAEGLDQSGLALF